jgi:hypothetical protein
MPTSGNPGGPSLTEQAPSDELEVQISSCKSLPSSSRGDGVAA